MSSATESRADRFARELADLKISDPPPGTRGCGSVSAPR
jgi:hypothetical protein